MTINILHTLTGGRRTMQLIVAERSPTENMIAVRAFRRPNRDLEARPVMSLVEAKAVRGDVRPAAALVASGLDDRICLQTIPWFTRQGCVIVIAILEDCDDRHRARSARGRSLLRREQA